MKAGVLLRGFIAAVLCALGLWLALATPYRSQAFVTDTASCRMAVQVVEPVSGAGEGSLVLLHGLSANARIMSYLAHAFAEQNLRVFVPDLPGHGRTPGPFSFVRAEGCAETFLAELIAHGAINPARTVLAGHSMGGAIAFRLAARMPVAGVVALSPAPMSAARGLPEETLPYKNPPAAPPNMLIISASWEPSAVRETARDLLARGATTSGKYLVVPRSTHVSLLFNEEALRASQNWAAQALHLFSAARIPSRLPFLGFAMGFAGLILLTAPFIREFLPKAPNAETCDPPRIMRLLVEFLVLSFSVILLLRWIHAYRILHVFEGDYLAGFLFLTGVALLLLHYRAVLASSSSNPGRAQVRVLLMAGIGAVIFVLLYSAWFDLTFSAAWLTSAKWLRIPFFLLVLLPYHFAEEIAVGPLSQRGAWQRLALALSLRFVCWSALATGVFLLHSGEILLVLLAPYLTGFCLLQRLGMDIVRAQTGSASSAAIFGAILMAGFCLAIFPVA